MGLLQSGCLVLGIFASSFAIGCGESEAPPVLPATVPFTGSIKLDGTPMNAGFITFLSTTEKGLNATGIINTEGKYSLKIGIGKLEKDGVVPGKYKVIVSRFVKPNGEPQDPSVPAEIPGRESLPPQYSSSTATRLVAEVPAAGGTADFEVKTK